MTDRLKFPETGEAYFSTDRRYRYALSRVWGPGQMVLFICLNPSTADEKKLDPTLRRVTRFAQREGYGGFWMGNLFALRSPYPKALIVARDPVGPENDTWLEQMARWTDGVICGWGAYDAKRLGPRDAHVKRLLDGYKLKCLGKTKFGHPRHPLYLSSETELIDL